MYMKESSSGNDEYCFMPSFMYTAECKDKMDVGQLPFELPGEMNKPKYTTKQSNKPKYTNKQINMSKQRNNSRTNRTKDSRRSSCQVKEQTKSKKKDKKREKKQCRCRDKGQQVVELPGETSKKTKYIFPED